MLIFYLGFSLLKVQLVLFFPLSKTVYVNKYTVPSRVSRIYTYTNHLSSVCVYVCVCVCVCIRKVSHSVY